MASPGDRPRAAGPHAGGVPGARGLDAGQLPRLAQARLQGPAPAPAHRPQLPGLGAGQVGRCYTCIVREAATTAFSSSKDLSRIFAEQKFKQIV